MKIELKNIKHAEFASHETNCFSASVYVDGVRAFTAENDGRGGCDFYHALPGKQELLNAAHNYAKSLPQTECSWIDPDTGKPAMLDMNLELLIGQLLEDELCRKERARCSSKGLAFHPDGDKTRISWYPFKGKPSKAHKELLRKEWLPQAVKSNPSAVFFDGKGNYYA